MDHPFRRLLPVSLLLLGIVLLGIAGYVFIEKWGVLDSIYMVITTLFTVGYQEVRPLSPPGKIFTMVLIVAGVGSAIYAAGRAVEIIVEGEMTGYRRRRRMEKRINELKNHYIICGFGRVGHQVAEVFEKSRTPFVVIDSKKETLQELEPRSIPSIIGDATSDRVLLEAGIAEAKGLVACSDSDVANVYVTLSARVLSSELYIVARAAFKDTEKKLLMAGANRVISPYFISGNRMAALALRPVTSDFLDLVSHGGQVDFSLYEITVRPDSPLIHKSLAQADIRRVSGALVLAIRKSNGSFDLQPNAHTTIDQDDVLVVIGTQEQSDSLQRMIRPA